MHFENVEITIKIWPRIIYMPGKPLQSAYSIYQGQPKSTVNKSHSISLHVHQINLTNTYHLCLFASEHHPFGDTTRTSKIRYNVLSLKWKMSIDWFNDRIRPIIALCSIYKKIKALYLA